MITLHVFVFVFFLFFTKHSDVKVFEATPLSISVIVPKNEQKKIVNTSKAIPKEVKHHIAPILTTKAASSSEIIELPVVQKYVEEDAAKTTNIKSEVVKSKPIEEKIEAVTAVSPIYNADYLQNPQPKYTILSRKLREEGTVVLRVFVEKDGSAKVVEIKTSSGYFRLDDSAVNAVKEWKFVPGKKGDDTIATWVNIPITFKLGV